MVGQQAVRAVGLAGGTDPPAMPNERVADEGPFALRDHFHEVVFDFDGVLGVFARPCKTKARGEATDVGVHDDAFVFSEGRAEHDIGRLARDAGQRKQVVHRVGNFSAEFIDDHSAGLLNVPRFLPKKARRVNRLLDLSPRRVGDRTRRRKAIEQDRRDLVDRLVRGLG